MVLVGYDARTKDAHVLRRTCSSRTLVMSDEDGEMEDLMDRLLWRHRWIRWRRALASCTGGASKSARVTCSAEGYR